METTTLQFEDTTIQIAGGFDGQIAVRKTYPGKIATGTGIGYWIAKRETGGDVTFYQPTHIQSGYSVCSYAFLDEQIAQTFIIQIEPLADWNRPIDAIVADPEYTHVIQKIKDITFDLVAQHPGAFGARW